MEVKQVIVVRMRYPDGKGGTRTGPTVESEIDIITGPKGLVKTRLL